MKRFLVRVLLFAFSFFLFEKVFYLILLHIPSLEKDNRLELVLEGKMNKEIIVLGSSRGARNIIAGQIEDSLSRSVFNLSYPGSDIEFHEFVLRLLLKHNKPPEMLMLVVDDSHELLPSEAINFRLDRLYPLVKYDLVNDELVNRGENSFISKYLVVARMNKGNLDLRKRCFSPLDTIMDCGSMPVSFQRKDRGFLVANDSDSYELIRELPSKVRAFKSLLSLCSAHDITLLIVFPPNLNQHNGFFESRLRSLSGPDVLFYRYDSVNSVFKDKAFFYDESHLQADGAEIFTAEVINFLRTLEKYGSSRTAHTASRQKPRQLPPGL